MQFFQTHKRDVVFGGVDDRPLMLFNVDVQCCPVLAGMKKAQYVQVHIRDIDRQWHSSAISI